LGLVSDTGQLWKWNLAIVLSVVSIGGPKVCSRWFEIPFWIDFWSPFFALGAFAFACFSIRCPKCGASWLWDAVSGMDFRKWEEWFWNLEECPSCTGLADWDTDPENSIRCPRCQQMSANQSFCDVCGKDLRASPPPLVLPNEDERSDVQPNLGIAADRDPRERGSRPLNTDR